MSSEPKQWKPFEEGPLTIEQRFADNPKGRARQYRVWELYVQQDNVACPLFDSTGALLDFGKRVVEIVLCRAVWLFEHQLQQLISGLDQVCTLVPFEAQLN